MLQILKGAPVDLMVGTDMQTILGFLFLDTSLGDTATGLHNSKEWDLSESQTTRTVSSMFPVVHLINGTRLPARYFKLD